jgi:hypothetical protein
MARALASGPPAVMDVRADDTSRWCRAFSRRPALGGLMPSRAPCCCRRARLWTACAGWIPGPPSALRMRSSGSGCRLTPVRRRLSSLRMSASRNIGPRGSPIIIEGLSCDLMPGQPYPCSCWSRDTVETMRFAAAKDRVCVLGRKFHKADGSVGRIRIEVTFS